MATIFETMGYIATELSLATKVCCFCFSAIHNSRALLYVTNLLLNTTCILALMHLQLVALQESLQSLMNVYTGSNWTCNSQTLGSNPTKVSGGDRKNIQPSLLLCLIKKDCREEETDLPLNLKFLVQK